MTNFYRLISLLLLTSLRIFLPFSTRNIGRLRERLSEPHVVAAAALAVSSSLVPTHREKRSDRPLNSGQFQFPFTPTSFLTPVSFFDFSPKHKPDGAPVNYLCFISRLLFMPYTHYSDVCCAVPYVCLPTCSKLWSALLRTSSLLCLSFVHRRWWNARVPADVD